MPVIIKCDGFEGECDENIQLKGYGLDIKKVAKAILDNGFEVFKDGGILCETCAEEARKPDENDVACDKFHMSLDSEQ